MGKFHKYYNPKDSLCQNLEDKCRNIHKRHEYLCKDKQDGKSAHNLLCEKLKIMQKNSIKNLASSHFVIKNLVPLLTYQLSRTTGYNKTDTEEQVQKTYSEVPVFSSFVTNTVEKDKFQATSSNDHNTHTDTLVDISSCSKPYSHNRHHTRPEVNLGATHDIVSIPSDVFKAETLKELYKQCEEISDILTGSALRKPIFYLQPINAIYRILQENGLDTRQNYVRRKIFPLTESSNGPDNNLNNVGGSGFLHSHFKITRNDTVVRPNFVLDFYKSKVHAFTFRDYDINHSNGTPLFSNFSDFFIGSFGMCMAYMIDNRLLSEMEDIGNKNPSVIISDDLCNSIEWYLRNFFQESGARKNEFFLAFENDFELKENLLGTLKQEFSSMQYTSGSGRSVFIRHLSSYPKSYTHKNAFRYVMDILFQSKTKNGELLANELMSTPNSPLIRSFLYELANYSYIERLGAMGSAVLCLVYCLLGEGQFRKYVIPHITNMSKIELLHINSASLFPGIFDILLMLKGQGHRDVPSSLDPTSYTEDFLENYENILANPTLPNTVSCFIKVMNCASTEHQILANPFKKNQDEKLQRIRFTQKVFSEGLYQLLEQSLNRVFYKTQSSLAVRTKLRNREHIYCRELSSLIVSSHENDAQLARYVMNGYLYEYKFDDYTRRGY